MGVLEDLGEAAARVATAVERSVVRIGRDGRGAGVVLRDGLVLTSAHNLRGSTVTVSFPDGRVASGEVKAADLEGDLAVLAVDTSGSPAIAWAPSDPTLGEAVFAVGPGRGPGRIRVTAGLVASTGAAFRGPRGRLIEDGFEHTAVVGRGSSGGPVVDGSGGLVGINTHRSGDGLYLALPANQALADRVEALARGEAPSRRRLGVSLVPGRVARRLRASVGLPPRDGLLVRDVDPDGPAAVGGVQAGDLIVAVGGREVTGIDDLASAVEAAPAAAPLGLTLVRGADEISVEVRFDQPPAA